MISDFKRFFLMLLTLMLMSNGASAHPHNWIDMQAELVIDDQLQLSGINMSWQFDPYYSITVLSEFKQGEKTVQQQLDELGDLMVNNLAEYGYYSEISLGQELLSLPKPKQWSLTVKDAQLLLTMDFQLSEKQAINGLALSLSTFDPTYYVSMNYLKSHNLLLPASVSTDCQWQLILPSPSEEMVEYAAKLDQTMKDTDGLGALFAEKMELLCQR